MTEEQQMSKRTAWYYVVLAIKGLCMGAADVVPGVSGGTIAFITGIYTELLNSIKSINLPLFRLLLKGKFIDFWRQLNGTFLLLLVFGILLSIFSLSKFMRYLLDTHPIPVWSFFMGLVIASAIYVLKPLKGLTYWSRLMLAAGIGAALIVSKFSPAETPNGYWFILLTGAIAICAMILPGISGSFIMLLMGKYEFIIDALSSLQWDILLAFAIGATIGIISFSRLLSWLLKTYYNQTVCLLAGFMFGSIEKIWPWKEAVSEGVHRNILPATYRDYTGFSPQTGVAVLFIFLGFFIVFGTEFLAKRVRRGQ